MRKIILILNISLLVMSCNHKVLNFDSAEKVFCDSTKSELFIRIYNTSKYNISNLVLSTDFLSVNFDEIKSNKVTCYRSIDSFNRECSYHFIYSNKIHVLKRTKLKGSGGNNIGDKISLKYYTSGYYTLIISFKNEYSYPEFELIKD